jgi:hypothetical protein
MSRCRLASIAEFGSVHAMRQTLLAFALAAALLPASCPAIAQSSLAERFQTLNRSAEWACR